MVNTRVLLIFFLCHIEPVIDIINAVPGMDESVSRLQCLFDNIESENSVLVSNWTSLLDSVESIDHDRPQDKLLVNKRNHNEASFSKWFYLAKMAGTGGKTQERDEFNEILLSFISSFISITILGAIDFYFLSDSRFITLIPAFGAMAALLLTKQSCRSPLAQPTNAVFGHVTAAIVGIIFRSIFSSNMDWLCGPVAVAVTVGLMSLTRTVHPAAGATAMLCVYRAPSRVTQAGWWFVVVPVLAGSTIILITALITNNISSKRKYPTFWW